LSSPTSLRCTHIIVIRILASSVYEGYPQFLRINDLRDIDLSKQPVSRSYLAKDGLKSQGRCERSEAISYLDFLENIKSSYASLPAL